MPPKRGQPKKKDPSDDMTERLYRLYRKKLNQFGLQIPRTLLEKFNQIRDEKNPGNLQILSVWEEIGSQGFKALIDALTELKYNRLKEIHVWQGACGDEGMRSLFHFLQNNQSVKTLDIKNSLIGPLGCDFIGQSLSPVVNNAVESLRLDYNGFSDSGLQMLSRGIQGNKNLHTLSLAYCDIKKTGGRFLMEFIIHTDCRIKDLNLQGNKLRNMGASILFRAMLVNGSIQKLNIADNQFGEEEEVLSNLRDMLLYNTSLRSLDLTRNGFYTMGGDFFIQVFTDACEAQFTSPGINNIVYPESIPFDKIKSIEKIMKELKKKRKKGKKKGKRKGKGKKRR